MSRQGNEPENQIVLKRPRQENRFIQHSSSSSIPRNIVSNVQGFDMFPVIRGARDHMSNWMSSLIQQQDGCLQMVAQRVTMVELLGGLHRILKNAHHLLKKPSPFLRRGPTPAVNAWNRPKTTQIRWPPDYSSNLCPPKTSAIWFFGGVFWAFCIRKQQEGGPKHPPKNHIANVSGGHRLDE